MRHGRACPGHPRLQRKDDVVARHEAGHDGGDIGDAPLHQRCAFELTALAITTDGLVYAAYLFIVAIGLTLIFGVMKILNVAHGSFYTFGAYGAATAVGVYFDRGLPAAGGFLLMALFAMAFGLVLGLVLERGVMRLVYGRDEVVMVLVT